MNAIELQQVAKFLKRMSDRAIVPNLDQLHLTRAEGAILSTLIRTNDLSITTIIRQTLLPQSQASTAIASLVQRKWVSVSPDASDNRKTVVSVVPSIREAAKQSFQREADSILEESLPELSPADIAKLSELITSIASVIRSRGEEL